MQCPFKDEKKNKQTADKPQQDLYESLKMSKSILNNQCEHVSCWWPTVFEGRPAGQMFGMRLLILSIHPAFFLLQNII